MCTTATSPRINALLAAPAQAPLVSRVRNSALHALTRWGLSEEERDTALLIVGELLANAAQHGRKDMALYLALCPHTLLICVGDHGGSDPQTRVPADPDEHGRGLTIVRALAPQFETHQDETGTRVYAQVPVVTDGPRTDPATPVESAQDAVE